jgi:hypothetical protein
LSGVKAKKKPNSGLLKLNRNLVFAKRQKTMRKSSSFSSKSVFGQLISLIDDETINTAVI